MRTARIALALGLFAAASCGSSPAPPPRATTGPTSGAVSGAQPGTGMPAAALPLPAPTGSGPCPYLDDALVEEINGQRVGDVRTSADQPYPACFFTRGDGTEQARTWVVEGTVTGALGTSPSQ